MALRPRDQDRKIEKGPAAWFQPISVGTFTKGLGFPDLWFNALMLVVFGVIYFVAAHTVLQKQEP